MAPSMASGAPCPSRSRPGAVEQLDVGDPPRAGSRPRSRRGRWSPRAPGVGGLHQVHVIGTFPAESERVTRENGAAPGSGPAPEAADLSSRTVPGTAARAASHRGRRRGPLDLGGRGSTTAEGLHAAATSASSAHTPSAIPAR